VRAGFDGLAAILREGRTMDTFHGHAECGAEDVSRFSFGEMD